MFWYKVSDTVIDFRTDRKFINSIDAAEITVREIMKNYLPPYRLMVSGGVDSQVMLWAWKQFGKNYIPTSVVYNNDYNDYDLTTLKEFSSRENLDVEYINFDLLKFYETRFEYIANRFRCISPQFAAHLGFAENLDGTRIFSGDRLYRTRGAILGNNVCLYNAAKEWNIIPYFLIHTPEIAYSLIHDISTDLLPTLGIPEMYTQKVETLRQCGFPVIGQDQKYNGFEKIKEYYQTNYRHVLTPAVKLRYKTPFILEPVIYDLLFRFPYEKKFGHPKFKHLLSTGSTSPDEYITIELIDHNQF